MKKFTLLFFLLTLLFLYTGCQGATSPTQDTSDYTETPEQVSAPVLDPPAGELDSVPATISFSSSTADVNFYYTTNGTEPTESSDSGDSFTLTEAYVLRVIAVKDGMTDSEITTAAYTVKDLPSDDPSLSELNPSMGIFAPAWDMDQFSYELIIPESTSTITFTPLSGGPGAAITQNLTTVISGEEGPSVSVSDGGTVSFHVTAEDGTTTREYELTLQTVNQDSWQVAEPEGICNKDFFNHVASSNDGTVLAAVSDYIYVSKDGGSSWSPSPFSYSSGWRCLTVSADGKVIVASDFKENEGIIRISRDSGTTWEDSPLLSDSIYDIALSSDGSRIYVATDSVDDDYLCMSTDTGNNWMDIDAVGGPGEDRWKEVECSADGLKVVAVNGDDMWFSSDGGTTWTSRSDIPATTITLSADGTKIASSDINSSYVYISTDFGATWIEQTGHRAGFLEYSPDGSLLLTAYDGYGQNDVEITENDGSPWAEYDNMDWGTFSAGITTDGGQIFASPGNTEGYCRMSADKGVSWTIVENLGVRDWTDIDISTDGKYQAAVFYSGYPEGFLFLSDDFGETWTENSSLETGEWKHAAISDNGQTIAVCDEDGEDIMISSDGGSSWSTKSIGTDSYDWGDIAVSPDGQTILALQQEKEPHISLNGGSTWSTVSGLTGDDSWSGGAISDNGSSLLLVSRDLYRSIDGGTSWEELDKYNFWTGGDISDDGSHILVFSTIYGTVEYSTDAGVSWQEIGFNSPDRDPVSASLSRFGGGIAVATEEDLLISMDYGESWDVAENAGSRLWTGIDASSDLSIIAGVGTGEMEIHINRE